MTEMRDRYWDMFWKVLSVMVIPWATGVTMLLFNVAISTANIQTQLDDLERRVASVEDDTRPEKRFYRRDGEALTDRIQELESLHPRQPQGGGP